MKKLIKWLYFKFVCNKQNNNIGYLKLKKEFEEFNNKHKIKL